MLIFLAFQVNVCSLSTHPPNPPPPLILMIRWGFRLPTAYLKGTHSVFRGAACLEGTCSMFGKCPQRILGIPATFFRSSSQRALKGFETFCVNPVDVLPRMPTMLSGMLTSSFKSICSAFPGNDHKAPLGTRSEVPGGLPERATSVLGVKGASPQEYQKQEGRGPFLLNN